MLLLLLVHVRVCVCVCVRVCVCESVRETGVGGEVPISQATLFLCSGFQPLH